MRGRMKRLHTKEEREMKENPEDEIDGRDKEQDRQTRKELEGPWHGARNLNLNLILLQPYYSYKD